MMTTMLTRILWGALACASFAAAADKAFVHPALGQVQKVYLLPMTSGFDQYLANQLAKQGVFEVVTDPKLADALIADVIGRGFEAKVLELFPPPPPPPVEKKETKEGEASEEPAPFDSAEKNARMTTFGRGKGNVFIVDVKSRAVVWSIYERPKDMSSKELDKTSEKIVSRLRKDLGK
jgi:hypothetical protein